jgi:hypothetical protein
MGGILVAHRTIGATARSVRSIALRREMSAASSPRGTLPG